MTLSISKTRRRESDASNRWRVAYERARWALAPSKPYKPPPYTTFVSRTLHEDMIALSGSDPDANAVCPCVCII